MSLFYNIRNEATKILNRTFIDFNLKNIFIWGAGDLGCHLAKHYKLKKFTFIDTNPTKIKKKIMGFSVIDKDELIYNKNNFIYITNISDSYTNCFHLEKLGYIEDKNFINIFKKIKLFQSINEIDKIIKPLQSFEIKGKKIVEIGFGSYLYNAIIFLFLGASKVYLTDINRFNYKNFKHKDTETYQEFLDLLCRKFKKKKMDVSFLIDKIYIIPRPINAEKIELTEKFDLVFNSGVMEHISNPQKAIKEFKKILQPDGIIFFAKIGIHDHRFNNMSYTHNFTPWSFLKYTDDEWSKFGNNSYHQNRCRGIDFINFCETENFRLQYYSSTKYDFLKKDEIKSFSKKFKNYTYDQLIEMDVTMIAQKN